MNFASLLRVGLCGALLWRAAPLYATPPTDGNTLPSVNARPVATDPELESVRADFEIALAALDNGDLKSALPLWLEIVARAPKSATPRANLALIELRLGHLDEAERSINEAIARQPQAAFYNQLGVIQRQKGAFSAARASYEQALVLDENLAHAHLNLAILCDLYLQELPTALEHYQRYQQLSGSDESKQLTSWIGDLERRIKVNP